MTINLQKPDITELKPRITVFGVGGGGGNAVNNMINAGLKGVEFVVANTDAQALTMSKAERIIQLGVAVTEGLGAGSQPEVGRAAAEECIDEITDHLNNTNMCFVTAGMGGGTGTGAAPVVARAAREKGILTVGVVTKPFHFEGQRRMRTADLGIEELQANVDTLIVIPNQNLFRIANDKTTFADAFGMADQVLFSGVACITDLMVKEGLINLDFADVRSVMREMGKAMMGTGEASGEGRAIAAAEAAIANPLLDETSMRGARGLLISITGGRDMTLFEVDEAATRIREEVDTDANIILGATFDEELEGVIRVSVVATGIDKSAEEISAQPVNQTLPHPVRMTGLRTPAATAPAAANTVSLTAVGEEDDNVDEEVGAALAAQLTLTRPDFQSNSGKPANRLFTPDQPVERQVAPVQPSASVRPAIGAEQAEAPRMPRVEDFPPVAKSDRHPQGGHDHDGDDRGPLGLLKRLTTGLAKPAGEDEPPIRKPIAAQRQQPMTRPASEADLYAPRRESGQMARSPMPAAVRDEEDQLEIPAFLRRQAN